MPRNRLADLRTALEVLTRDRNSMVMSHSRLKDVGGVIVPVKGSLDPEAKADVAEYDVAIGAVRDVIKSGEAAAGRRRCRVARRG